MPLYTYECLEHGVMEFVVPLELSEQALSCPLCAYNDYLDTGTDDMSKSTPRSPVDFSTWLEQGWEKLWTEGMRAQRLVKVPEAPMFIVRLP